MKRLFLAVPLLVLLLAGPVSRRADATVYEFQVDMFGDQVVPPVSTHAWGFVRFFFNDDRTEASYTVDVKGIGQNVVTGADMHAGAPGANGPAVRHLADGGFIVTAGHLTLTPAELAAFASGNWYVVLKTVDHPEGEIRGQVVVPADFLPGAAPTRAPAQQPPAAAPPQASPGFIQPPSTGDAGLR